MTLAELMPQLKELTYKEKFEAIEFLKKDLGLQEKNRTLANISGINGSKQSQGRRTQALFWRNTSDGLYAFWDGRNSSASYGNATKE